MKRIESSNFITGIIYAMVNIIDKNVNVNENVNVKAIERFSVQGSRVGRGRDSWRKSNFINMLKWYERRS